MEDYIKVNKSKLFYNFTNIKNKPIYADFIASGQPSPIIDNYIIKNVYPYYSNTHSNASNGIIMKNLIQDSRQYIKQYFNLDDDYDIIFSGNGTTGAINHLVNSIDYTLYENVDIFISSYEHYSNHLPWVELTKSYSDVNSHGKSHINLHVIPFNLSDQLDLSCFENKINNLYRIQNNTSNTKNLIITSIIHCSNVNGLFTPIEHIQDILDKYTNKNITKFFFTDYACSAPYANLNGQLFDAIFFSPHKFIGGTSTPGVLIAKKNLFMKKTPYCPGGGCVLQFNNSNIIYQTDIEKRESAGTPNIIGIIKIKQILILKNACEHLIVTNEHILHNILVITIKYLKNKYDNFIPIMFNYSNDNYSLPILSFYLKNIHYNLIVAIFSDYYKIQTRGGNSCCGLLSDHMKNKYNIDGWCRISFHWSMSENEIFYILGSLENIINNHEKYIDLYKYDPETNLYIKK